MKEIKSIKGAQPTAEIIRTTKVYDWVVLSNSADQLITVGTAADACNTAIQEAILAGQVVTAKCVINNAPQSGIFPLQTCPQVTVPGGVNCSAVVIQQPITVQGSDQAACVKLYQTLTATVTFLANGVPITACPAITVPFSLNETTVLCLPQPLTSDNICCNIYNVSCTTSTLVNVGTPAAPLFQVDIAVSLCKEIQVEADVKLQVTGTFAQPRGPIPCPPAAGCPTTIVFPPQCPSIYPPITTACNCTGFLNAMPDGVSVTITNPTTGLPTTLIGQVDASAAICPNCQGLTNSTLAVSFDPEYPYSIDSGFSFTAVTFDPATFTCALGTLTIGGTGVFTYLGVTTPVTFTFTMTQLAGVCTFSIALVNATTLLPIVSITAAPVVPCDSAHFFIDSCR